MPVQSLSLSWRLPLFVSPKGTVYAPYPSLLCAHLLRFQSIPPQCLLSPSIVPINYSAQSLPPTGGVSPPPLEMNDWQVCSVSNIHSDNRREGKWLGFSQRENCRRQRRVRKSGGQRERTLYIYILSYIYDIYHGMLLKLQLSLCLPISWMCLLSATLRFLPQIYCFQNHPVHLFVCSSTLRLIFVRYCWVWVACFNWHLNQRLLILFNWHDEMK